MEIPWKLKKLLIALFGEDRVKNRREFTPDFSVAAFAGAVDAMAQDSLPESAIVDRFLASDRPDLLQPMHKILSLADELIARQPNARDAILAVANSSCTEGLAIYNTRSAPLDGNFPWHQLQKGPDNDPLYMSRPQRFGFAPVLAQAALFDPQYLALLDDVLAGWRRYASSTPYRWAYNSNHAVIYRILALSLCWTFVGALHQQQASDRTQSVLFSILTIIRNDALFLSRGLGKAHPNNHLLADFFGAWLLQHLFPELVPATQDFAGYEERWHRELLRQFYPDGGSFEHAVHYQEHGCEMALVYLLARGPESIPEDVLQRIGNMLRFGAVISGAQSRPWELGDTTEDTLLPLDDTCGWSQGLIAAVLRRHFAHAASITPPPAFDQKAWWLLGALPDEVAVTGTSRTMQCFADSGFAHWTGPGDEELLLRTGVQPGTQFIQGHMHADALSLYWRLGSVDLLGASGTFSYRFAESADGNYRNYFCGPWSHSTIVIADADPLGVLDSGFRRRDNGLRVQQKMGQTESPDGFVTARVISENSYNGLGRVVVRLAEGVVVVFDSFTPTQCEQEPTTLWHFGRGVDVTVDGDEMALQVAQERLAGIRSLQPVSVSIRKGATAPPAGWQSGSYGVKHPVNVASCTCPPAAHTAWLLFSAQSDVGAARMATATEDSVVVDITIAGEQVALVFALGAGQGSVGVENVQVRRGKSRETIS